MTCTRPDDKVSCIVAQSQGDSQTGRRKFAFELQTPASGRSEGLVLMPFGLAIEPGVSFKLDEQTLGKGAPYMTCGAEGCFVPISFPTLALDGMRNAKTLTVTGQKAERQRSGDDRGAAQRLPAGLRPGRRPERLTPRLRSVARSGQFPLTVKAALAARRRIPPRWAPRAAAPSGPARDRSGEAMGSVGGRPRIGRGFGVRLLPRGAARCSPCWRRSIRRWPPG